MRKWPGLSETAVHVHHNVWWDLSVNPAKGPRTSLWRHFSVVMTPMQASSGWGISVCGHLNSSVTCGPVVPSQVVCSAVFLPYLNHILYFIFRNINTSLLTSLIALVNFVYTMWHRFEGVFCSSFCHLHHIVSQWWYRELTPYFVKCILFTNTNESIPSF